MRMDPNSVPPRNSGFPMLERPQPRREDGLRLRDRPGRHQRAEIVGRRERTARELRFLDDDVARRVDDRRRRARRET